MVDTRFHRSRGIHQRVMDNGCASIVSHTMGTDGVEHRLRIDFAQTDINSCTRSHDPWKTPAVAMKHWHHPQIDWMGGHIPL